MEQSFEICSYRDFFTKPYYMTAWGKIYHKSLFDSIKYPVGRYHEDEFTTYKICYEAKKIAYTESQLLFYRQREGSIMANMSPKRILDVHDALKGQVDFFLEHNENQLYATFLVIFASSYSKFKKYDNEIIPKWKSELKEYTIKPLTFRKKANFILLVWFPKFRKFLNKIYNAIKK